MQVIGYVKVSTEEQAKEGISLDAQKARITEWCDLHRHQLVAVYEDARISGCSMTRRPGIQAALAHVCKLKDAVFVVWNLSRLARDNYDAAAIPSHVGS
jgi:site-specific DNA recombinase